MSIQENIFREYKILKQNGTGIRSDALRKLRCEIQYQVTRSGCQSLTDDKIIDLLKNRIRSKKENALRYSEVGRDDLALLEEQEATVLRTILPPEITVSEIRKTVRELLQTSGTEESRQLNRIMGILMNRYKGKNIDGARASAIVKELLADG